MLFRAFVIFLALASQIMAMTEVRNPSINYKDTSFKLKNSLYLDGDTLYFPLLEMKEIKDLRVAKSHKNNGFRLYDEVHSFLFIRQSNEVWIDNSKHFMSEALKEIHGKPYIRLSDSDFIFDLNYNFDKDKQILSFIPSSRSFNVNPNQFNAFKHIRGGTTALPFKALPNQLLVAYQGHHVDILSHSLVSNERLYIAAAEVLNQLGFSAKDEGSNIVLSLQGFDYVIPKDSRVWQASHNSQSWDFMASAPVFVSNNASFVDAESLFAFLDYSLYWNHFTSTIEILTNIHDFKFVEAENDYQISIVSRYALSPSHDNIHQKKDRYYTLIPYAKVFGKLKQKWKDHAIIDRMSLKNLNLTYEQASRTPSDRYQNKSHVRVEYRIKSPEYAAYFKATDSSKDKSSGLTVHLDSRLKGISVKENASNYKVTFSLTKKVDPKIIREGKKLIIDFPDTVNELPRIKTFEADSLLAVRTSQFSTSPLISRAVLDFSNKAPTYMTSKDGYSLELTFPKESPSAPKATVAKKPSSTEKTKVSVTKKSDGKTSKSKRYVSSKTASRKGRSLKNKVVVIDAGHGGKDPGAVVKRSIYEKNYTLDIAKKLAAKFEAAGAHVVMTRTGDSNPSLRRRIYIANKNKADVFVSVHLNSFTSPKARGSETYYYKSKDKQLAQYIQKQLKKDLGIKSNGIKRNRFFVLRHTKMPSILIEPMFITNPKELALLKQDAYRDKLADSIYIGVRSYFQYKG